MQAPILHEVLLCSHGVEVKTSARSMRVTEEVSITEKKRKLERKCFIALGGSRSFTILHSLVNLLRNMATWCYQSVVLHVPRRTILVYLIMFTRHFFLHSIHSPSVYLALPVCLLVASSTLLSRLLHLYCLTLSAHIHTL